MKHGHVLVTGVSTLLHLTGYDWSCILSVSLPFKSPAFGSQRTRAHTVQQVGKAQSYSLYIPDAREGYSLSA